MQTLVFKKTQVEQRGCIRILLADDFNPWRAEVRSILQARPEWKVVCEASDGIEAVQKASELYPDIILLDIGMPRLNGIEAAKRIRQKSPDSKILFLTQDGDNDIKSAALSIGAGGYVLKSEAARELVPIIAAALGNVTLPV